MDAHSLSHEEESRYSRQILLDEMSNELQFKIKQSKILIIGAGGLGSPCLMYLSGSGVGTLGIVDNDNVDPTNLHRQVIHFTNNRGKNKAESAKEYIQSWNPNVKVIVYRTQWTNWNSWDICKDYDVIMDCCDNPLTRYIANDISVLLGKPFISGASVRWDGQWSWFIKDSKQSKLPCYRCWYPEPPLKENVKKCNQVGVMGTIPGVIGTWMANEAIKWLTGMNDKLLSKRLLIFDGLDMRVKIVKYRDFQKNCKICGEIQGREIKNRDDFEKYDYWGFISGEKNSLLNGWRQYNAENV